jgi:hypothetical protein
MSKKKTKNRGRALQPDPSNQSSNQNAPMSTRTRKAVKKEPAHAVQSNWSEPKPPHKPNNKPQKKVRKLYARVKTLRAKADRLELEAKRLQTSAGKQEAGGFNGGGQHDPIIITEDESDDQLNGLADSLASLCKNHDDNSEEQEATKLGIGEADIVWGPRGPVVPEVVYKHKDRIWGPVCAAVQQQAAVWLRTRLTSKLPRAPTAEYIPASQFNASDLVMSGGLPAAAPGRPKIDNSHLLDVETHLHIAKPRKRERSYSPNLDYIPLEGEISDSEDDMEGPPVYKKHRSQYQAARPVTNNLLWDVD